MREAAQLLKLEPFLDRKPLKLSGGQQQRTAIARALVKGADLVLLDEPLANLDYKLREELREELPRIFAASGAIFVYATTEPQEALLLGGNTATLVRGPRHAVRPDAAGLPPTRTTSTTARVFSDPPLNILGDREDAATALARDRAARSRPTGGLRARCRTGAIPPASAPHHLSLDPTGADAIALPARSPSPRSPGRRASSISMSAAHRFVALVAGVRRLEPGARGRQPISIRPVSSSSTRPAASRAADLAQAA